MRYKPGPHQYTERQMKQRVAKLWLKLLIKPYHNFPVLSTLFFKKSQA